jgi:ATP-dependent DNA helicase RecQ
MKKLLKKYFGFDEFRPMQKEIIETVLNKKDALVLMPTGGGKSLCYQLPALKLKGITLVISPLIALMKDQVDSLRANGIEAEFINSSLELVEVKAIEERVEKGNTRLLFVAPERLKSSYFYNWLKSVPIRLIAIDEAHCISEWGHDFRPYYRHLKIFKKDFKQVPVIALTATATKQVREDIKNQLDLKKAETFVSSFNRENLKITILRKQNAFAKLCDLVEKYKKESIIIYCFSRKETEEVAFGLKNLGYSAAAYHAGLDKEERKGVQEKFIKDELKIIVATIAFGMGIDKPDVRLIVHYSFPKTLEGYYQEIGRAGRDGLSSECVMLYSYGDIRKHEFFIDQMEDPEFQKITRQKLNQVIDYCESNDCRKKIILDYFGEKLKKDNCQGCDFCLSSREYFDATVIVQKILSAILKTGNTFGKSHIIDVLLGSQKKKVLQLGHNNLSVHGIISEFRREEVNFFIQNLITQGLIQKEGDKYPILKVTNKGILFLKNREKIELLEPPTEEQDFKAEKIEEKDYDLALFERLRALRLKIAKEENVPNFVIFGDVSLREMAHFYPVKLEDFSQISGVGESKLNKYAKRFISVIQSHVEKFKLKPKSIKRKRNASNNKSNPKVKAPTFRYQLTKQMVEAEKPLEEIAKAQNLKYRTIFNHLEKLVLSGEIKNLDYLKKQIKNFHKIKKAILATKQDFLKPVFEKLNEEESYDDIILVKIILKVGN